MNFLFFVQGREPDDLVAMGTIWSPNLQQRNSTTTSTTTSSKSFSLSSSSNTSNVNPRKGPSATITRTGFPPNISTVRQPAKDCKSWSGELKEVQFIDHQITEFKNIFSMIVFQMILNSLLE